MSKNPFLIFSWYRPFLPDLKKQIDLSIQNTQNTPILIVPNNRPWRYIANLYVNENKATILPKVLSLSDVINIWANYNYSDFRYTTNLLDRIGLLYEVINELDASKNVLIKKLQNMDISDFLPWGIHLDKLLEELFINGIITTNIDHTENEVSPIASAILASLGQIQKQYLKKIEELSWTSQGLNCFFASKNIHNIPPLLQPNADKAVFIAGFSTLTNTEEKIFYTLWKAGATICLHTDPTIIEKNAKIHFACENHRKWQKKWNATLTLDNESNNIDIDSFYSNRENIEFFSCHDYHSQLSTLKSYLKNNDNSLSTAIILANNNLLMPLLHHLDDKKCNISMGYPLTRSPFLSLIKLLFEFDISKMQDGRYPCKKLLKLLQHPYLFLLNIEDTNGNISNLKNVIYHIKNYIINNKEPINIDTLYENISIHLNDTEKVLFNQFLQKLLKDLSNIKTLKNLSEYLNNLCDFIIKGSDKKLKDFPLDAEAIYYIINDIITELKNNILSDKIFSKTIIYEILKTLCDQGRIAFEAEPLTGLQILGLFETRLLHFDNVFIMDVTDDVLPGHPKQDPLLPTSLRMILGLPDNRIREQILGYILFNICAHAKNIYFFWQESINKSTLFDSKKVRSRFIEQLIWEKEKIIEAKNIYNDNKNNILINANDPKFNVIDFHIKPISKKKKQIIRTEKINIQLNGFLQKDLSATTLNSYIQCPLSFMYKYICKFKSNEIKIDKVDHALIGTCIHDTLYELYRPYINKKFNPKDFTLNKIEDSLKIIMDNHNLKKSIPMENYILFTVQAPDMIQKVIKKHPEKAKIIDLEKKYVTFPIINNTKFKFVGRIDRIDEQDGLIYIYDYKTGAVPTVKKSFFDNDELFSEISDICINNKDVPDELIDKIKQYTDNIQLPFYINLLNDSNIQNIGNASFIELRNDAKVHSLFKNTDQIDRYIDNCKVLIEIIVRHIQKCTFFSANPSDNCKYCDYKNLCVS